MPVRWGIMGTGRIANTFAGELAQIEGNELAGVASRQQARALDFAERHHIGRAYDGYASLARAADIDVVYVATPHALHCENTLLCLHAGKHVLCEKPFAMSATEALAMVEAAEVNQRFLMEAMWMRCFPLIQELQQRVANGEVGDVRMVQADFGFRAPFDQTSRLFDPALGGGAILDVGVYAIAFANLLLGEPIDVVSLPSLGRTGVDEQSACVLRHETGALSVLSAAIRTRMSNAAWVYGTAGRVRVAAEFWKPQQMTLFVEGANPVEMTQPYPGTGYQFEIHEVLHCLRRGALQSAGDASLCERGAHAHA